MRLSEAWVRHEPSRQHASVPVAARCVQDISSSDRQGGLGSVPTGPPLDASRVRRRVCWCKVRQKLLLRRLSATYWRHVLKIAAYVGRAYLVPSLAVPAGFIDMLESIVVAPTLYFRSAGKLPYTPAQRADSSDSVLARTKSRVPIPCSLMPGCCKSSCIYASGSGSRSTLAFYSLFAR